MLVGLSVVLWTIWILRNSIIFDNNKINDPRVPVNMIARWLNDWVLLQKNQESQETLRWGVKMFELIANEFFRVVHGWRVGVNRIIAT